jgi:acyl dehydratase
MRYFEDFTVGQVITYPGPTVSAADIVAFAREYDPQPFHLSEEAAKGTFAGRLIASGWHTACLHMRMLVDCLLRDAAGLGAPGIDELRWLKPVVPGDTLRARSTVLDLRRSSKGNRGFVRFAFEVLNQQDDVVMAQTNSIMFACRTTEMGDTITCATTLLEARPSASRPGWGLARSHNTGVNQRGELVFEFTSAVFWGMRGS